MNTVAFIEKNKIICICRKIYGDDLYRLGRAIYDGGVRMMEVAFDQADPACLEKTGEAIAMLRREFGNAASFGAGTVLTRPQLQTAMEAGAEFIISPNTDPEIIRLTKEWGMVSIPGAMTPSEIVTAHQAGADFVKLFPTVRLGTQYIKDIKGPLNHIKLIGTGGLNEENIKEYMDLGMVGFGISGRLVDKKLRMNGDYAQLSARAAAFMEIVNGQGKE